MSRRIKSASVSTSHLSAIADLQPEGHYLSKKFRSPHADVIFQSADEVRFHVCKKDLATFSGGFPPAEFGSDISEIVGLPEKAVVLDLLFSFARPQRYPDIHALKIGTLVELGDAAEKYEVYAVIIACKMAMRGKILTDPHQVLAYAAKFEYEDLADEAAPFVLGTPPLAIFETMPQQYLRPWFRYLAALEPLRKVWTDRALDMLRKNCPKVKCCQNDLVKCLMVQMPNKVALLEARGSLCQECWQHMIFINPLDSSRERWVTRNFMPFDIERAYEGFPKFSTFL